MNFGGPAGEKNQRGGYMFVLKQWRDLYPTLYMKVAQFERERGKRLEIMLFSLI